MRLLNNLHFPIHTFGFGQYKNIDSQYLLDISNGYDGMFGYIPDAVHLGTAFVNGIANIIATCAHGLDLKLKFPPGTKIEKVIAGERYLQLS